MRSKLFVASLASLLCWPLFAQRQLSIDDIREAVMEGRKLFTNFHQPLTIEQRVDQTKADVSVRTVVIRDYGIGAPSELNDPRLLPLADEVKASDIVVRAKVVHDTSALTADQTFIFTVSEAEVEEVLAGGKSEAPQVGAHIEVLWPGGWMKVHGYHVSASVSQDRPLLVGNEFFLILHRLEGHSTYELLGQGSFDITKSPVEPIYPNTTRVSLDNMKDRDAFINNYRFTVVNAGAGR